MLTLLKTSNELARFVRVDFTSVPKPVHHEEERLRAQLLVPLLGAPLLHWLDGQYEAGVTADDESLAGQLLRKVQGALALLSIAGSLEELQVSLDDTGVHITTTTTTKTAFQWQTTGLDRALMRKGYLGMNALLQWLEENREESDELKAWAAGPGQNHRRQLLVSAAEFSRFENIQDSWEVFEALRPLLRTQELFILEPQLGYDFLSELRDQVRTRTLTPDNEKLLEDFIWPALAACTLAKAIPELGLRLTGDGIELMVARIDTDNSKEADAGLDSLLQARGFNSQRTADILLEKMRAFLNRSASATRYATYFNYGPYRSPSTPAAVLNTAESRVYRVI